MLSLLIIIIIFLASTLTTPAVKNHRATASLTPVRLPLSIGTRQIQPRPHLKDNAQNLELEAKAAIAVDRETGKILYEKNISQRLPIASLTKLMTALVVVENVSLDEVVSITKNAVETEGNRINLLPDETITAKNLLGGLLISSSNDAAAALAEYISHTLMVEEDSSPSFVDLMNKRAETLNLNDTHFSNPTGLDEPQNFSTASDLARFTSFLLDRPIIFEISKTAWTKVYSTNGRISHTLKNTNKLLGVLPNIVGAKTGYTEEAKQTMILVIKDPSTNHHIISAVLGSKNRFIETKELVEWVLEAYEW